MSGFRRHLPRWRPFTGRLWDNQSFLGYALVAPVLIWLVVVLGYPLVSTAILSLHDQRMIGIPGPFVGLELYQRVLFDPDYELWETLQRSLVWTLGNTVLHVLLGLGIALVLNQSFVGRGWLRTWLVIPWVIPPVVMAIIWRWMLHPTSGVVSLALQELGLVDKPIALLGEPSTAMAVAIGVFTWRSVPLIAITLLGALQTIPKEQYEAARVDGANPVQQFISVTLPGIVPTLMIATLLSSLWSFTQFGGLWLLTTGGPQDATTTLPILLYRKGFREFRLSEGAVLSMITLLCSAVLVAAYLWKAEEDEE